MSASWHKMQSVARAGIVALTLLAAARANGQSEQKTAWLRIIVSEKRVVYLRVQGLELRAAMSVEGLQSAAPMKMRVFGGAAAQAREFALPIPADQLPAGINAVKIGLWLGLAQPNANAPIPPGLSFSGKLTLCRTDDQKSEWLYVTSINSVAGTSAEDAPSIRLPALGDLKITVTAVPSEGKVGVGLALSAGEAALPEIRKDGKPLQVSVSVVNSAGETVAQKSGTLADFGFS